MEIARAVVDTPVERVIVAWSNRREGPIRSANFATQLNGQSFDRTQPYTEVSGVEHISLLGWAIRAVGGFNRADETV